MRLSRRSFLTSSVSSLLGITRLVPAQQERLRRKDSFFGIHFDLHPNNRDTALGRDVSEEMIERFLLEVKPDYVQYDCKGHVGYLGYPSAVSTPASGIVKDSLALWRRVTARHRVALYVHFSGVWDSLAIQQHPEWACTRPDGTRDPNATSLFGPYVDQRMIPQLKEAAAKYDLDGAWVDGECWAARPDYSPLLADAFEELTGLAQFPRGPSDRGWLEFLEFNRTQFRRYLKHYLDELHKYRPGFQIASNWMYTTYAPERPELPVDFISGDYLGNAAISAARLESRYLSAVGKPWDLMAWGFQSSRGSKVGIVHKPAVQLQQEAAIVLAQGGGFQIYYQPTRGGQIDDRHIRVMAAVAGFCRARQPFCHQSERVPQVGVLFSGNSLYRTAGKMFGGWGAAVNAARGVVDALLECHYSVDVIPDWQLRETGAQFPLIIVPDWPDLGGEIKQALTQLVESGGTVLMIGAANATLFASELAVRLAGSPSHQVAFVDGGEVFGNMSGDWQSIDVAGSACVEERYPTYDSTRDAACAVTARSLGKGRLAAIYGPLGEDFALTHAAATRRFLQRVVSRLVTPDVEVTAPPVIEVALRRKRNALCLHLVNCAGMQVAGEYAAVDYIPPVGAIEVAVRLPARPTRVTLEPGGRLLTGEWRDGQWRGTVDKLEIYDIICFEE